MVIESTTRRDGFALNIAAGLLLASAISLSACSLSPPDFIDDPADSGNGTGDVEVNPESTNAFIMTEGFENTGLGASWTIRGTDPAQAVVIEGISYAGNHSLRFNSRPLYSGETIIVATRTESASPAHLRFRYMTDIDGATTNTYFRFYVDGALQLDAYGTAKPWKTFDLNLAAGNHSLEWRIEKNSNYYYDNPITNCVWLDEVTLCDDEAASLAFSPSGPQWSVVADPLVAYAVSVNRADGSAIANAHPVLSVIADSGDGVLDGAGLFTGTVPGKCRIRAVIGSVSAYSEPMEILPENNLFQPIAYAGHEYSGQNQVGFGNPLTDADANIVIAAPAVSDFNADGYFVLRGEVSYTGEYQYILVKVIKDSTAETTSYLLMGEFATRIWLRFGAGAYTVTVHKLWLMDTNLNYEGDFGAYSYSPSAQYTFKVNNIRDEDGRYRYPSGPLQADDLRIRNLASDLCYGLTDPAAIEKKLHDYVVTSLYYDDDSLIDGYRKKQDAISVLANRTGVCEGYTSLFGALARAAGIAVKAVSGDAGGGINNHAWNLVDNGAGERMIDCTWDDPAPNDAFPDNLYWTYFLCGLSGVNNDHNCTDYRPARAIIQGMRFGMWPEGSY